MDGCVVSFFLFLSGVPFIQLSLSSFMVSYSTFCILGPSKNSIIFRHKLIAQHLKAYESSFEHL